MEEPPRSERGGETPAVSPGSWNIARPGRDCADCRVPFQPEQVFYSCLLRAGDELERQDVCLACWKDHPRESVFSFWRSVTPRAQEKKVTRTDVLLDFFRKVVSQPSSAPRLQQLAYLVGLVLTQKRILQILPEASGTSRARMRLKDSRQNCTWELVPPAISEEELESLRKQLARLFEGVMPSEEQQEREEGERAEEATAEGGEGEGSNARNEGRCS